MYKCSGGSPGHIVWCSPSCMSTEAFWVPGSHSHWSHIRLIKSDSRPASWLTQFAPVHFPFHAEHMHAHIYSDTDPDERLNVCTQTENRRRVGQHPLSSNEKQRKLLPWQLPAHIFRRTQISCLTAVVLFWFSFDSHGIPRRISSPPQEFMQNHLKLNSRNLRRREAEFIPLRLKKKYHKLLNGKSLIWAIPSWPWASFSVVHSAVELLYNKNTGFIQIALFSHYRWACLSLLHLPWNHTVFTFLCLSQKTS